MIQGFQIFSVWMGTISGGMHLSGRAAPCAVMAKIAVAGQRLVLMIAVSDPVLGALPAALMIRPWPASRRNWRLGRCARPATL